MRRILIWMFLFCSQVLAQGPRILIVTDLEGAGGVNDARGSPWNATVPGQYPASSGPIESNFP